MHFFVFRCSKDKELFLATSTRSIPKEAAVLCDGKWASWNDYPKSGEPRLAFPSEEEIEEGVKEKGYLTFRAGVYVKEVKAASPQPSKKKR